MDKCSPWLVGAISPSVTIDLGKDLYAGYLTEQVPPHKPSLAVPVVRESPGALWKHILPSCSHEAFVYLAHSNIWRLLLYSAKAASAAAAALCVYSHSP